MENDVGFIVIAAWAVGVLGVLLSVLLWVRPRRVVGIGALVLGFLGCALALTIPFRPVTAVADIPDQNGVNIICGSLRAPQTDFTAYQYTGEDSSDPKLLGRDAGGAQVGPGGDPQLRCSDALSQARTGAIGGGALAAITLLVTLAHSYRRPGGDKAGPDETDSSRETPDAEISI
jgi:hypothetical protein